MACSPATPATRLRVASANCGALKVEGSRLLAAKSAPDVHRFGSPLICLVSFGLELAGCERPPSSLRSRRRANSRRQCQRLRRKQPTKWSRVDKSPPLSLSLSRSYVALLQRDLFCQRLKWNLQVAPPQSLVVQVCAVCPSAKLGRQAGYSAKGGSQLVLALGHKQTANSCVTWPHTFALHRPARRAARRPGREQ